MFELSEDDRRLWRAFTQGAISPGEFDHRTHLRLGYMYLAVYGPEAAGPAFKESLLAYLAHHGIHSGKYHETLTRAWLLAVWHFMCKAGSTACAEEFLAQSGLLLSAEVMLTHYSKNLLFSDLARAQFLAPDLEPIPR
jgi:hypothetical protein